jgi:L-iditol 2-dehydrogenase
MWYNNADIRIENMPTPVPGPDEMLVKVNACGICGSDVVEWYRLPRAPLVQGHEIGAEVISVGANVTKFAPGDRVFIAPKVPCMKCGYCKAEKYPLCTEIKERLPGGFAEYILVPPSLIEHGAYRLPNELSFEQSTFIEPLACAVRAQRLADIKKGHIVLILGCGMSGLLHVKLAAASGCRTVATDIQPSRLALAKKNGADIACSADEDVPRILEAKYGKKADAVIICASPLSVIEQAWQSVDKGGATVFFAVPSPDKQVTVPINAFWTREMRILTSYYCGPDDISRSIELLQNKSVQVEDLITHRLPLDKIADGFRMVLSGTDSIKVIIKPNGM